MAAAASQTSDLRLNDASKALRSRIEGGASRLSLAREMGVNKKSIPSLMKHPHTVQRETRDKFVNWFGKQGATAPATAAPTKAGQAPKGAAGKTTASPAKRTAAKQQPANRVTAQAKTTGGQKSPSATATQPATATKASSPIAKTASSPAARKAAPPSRKTTVVAKRQGFGAKRADTPRMAAAGGRPAGAAGGSKSGTTTLVMEGGRRVHLEAGATYHLYKNQLLKAVD